MNIWGPETDFGVSTEDMREALDLHLARYLGEFQAVFTDEEGWAGLSSEDGPPVDVLVVPPDGERKFAYVTSLGCSFAPLPSPRYRENNVIRRVEFVLAAQQNGNQEHDMTALNLAANTVRRFAKLAHINGVPIEEGETVTFTETAHPGFTEAGFGGFGFAKPQLPNVGFERMRVENGNGDSYITFIAPIPLFTNEIELASDIGPSAMCDSLLRASVTEMIDLKRHSFMGTESKETHLSGNSEVRTLWQKMLSWVGIT